MMQTTTTTYKPRRKQETCRCSGYPFPHRKGSKQCKDDDSGCFCGSCGEPAESADVDFGIGAYECWGRTGVDSDVQTVSRCCEAELFADASLTTPYEPEPYDPD